MRLFLTFSIFILFAFCLKAQEAQPNFITIPAASYRIIDGITGIPSEVTVDAFMISKTEVTQKEFNKIMGYNPSYTKGTDHPVENVSWWEAVRYCNERSMKEGLRPCYNITTGECDLSRNGYRLPTDAEWSLADSIDTEYTAESIHRHGNIGSSNTKVIPLLIESLHEKGTERVGSFRPNSFGLYDMTGNVWEWCTDFYDAALNIPVPIDNPKGKSWGLEKIIRGGSFISLVTNRSIQYTRSALNPEYKSRFTGFRICRSTGKKDIAAGKIDDSKWFEPYNRVPENFKNNTGNLSPLLTDSKGSKIRSVSEWEEKAKLIKEKWLKFLGEINNPPPGTNVKLIQTFKEEIYTGKLMYLQVESDYWEKIFLMIPGKKIDKPLPVVIVPYYDVDTPAGMNMGGRVSRPRSVRSFAYQMVEQGYIAIAVRWYSQSYGEFVAESVSNLLLRHPGCKGLGKWVSDVHKVIDYLYTLPEVDRGNIGIIGHSLGGKMTMYAAAFDERITAVVSSELGIGLEFSNYADYWYLSDEILTVDKSMDHHELLGLIAPRPFLLIGGDSEDNDKSWYYINTARKVYDLYGKPQNIGYFNHRTGHSPTPESINLSVEWLKHFLNN